MKKHTGRRDTETLLADFYDRIQALERLTQENPMIAYRLVCDGTDKHNIVVGECTYRGHYVSNAHSEFVYVHLYDKATAPVDGDTPVVTLGIPFESGANNEYEDGVGDDANVDDKEVFELGLGVAVSTSPHSSAGAVPADLVVVNIFYSVS